jgi:hypothetical protein
MARVAGGSLPVNPPAVQPVHVRSGRAHENHARKRGETIPHVELIKPFWCFPGSSQTVSAAGRSGSGRIDPTTIWDSHIA